MLPTVGQDSGVIGKSLRFFGAAAIRLHHPTIWPAFHRPVLLLSNFSRQQHLTTFL
jgi:hypothetical protein